MIYLAVFVSCGGIFVGWCAASFVPSGVGLRLGCGFVVYSGFEFVVWVKAAVVCWFVAFLGVVIMERDFGL